MWSPPGEAGNGTCAIAPSPANNFFCRTDCACVLSLLPTRRLKSACLIPFPANSCSISPCGAKYPPCNHSWYTSPPPKHTHSSAPGKANRKATDSWVAGRSHTYAASALFSAAKPAFNKLSRLPARFAPRPCSPPRPLPVSPPVPTAVPVCVCVVLWVAPADPPALLTVLLAALLADLRGSCDPAVPQAALAIGAAELQLSCPWLGSCCNRPAAAAVCGVQSDARGLLAS